jgi:hypothetical protein
MKTNGLDIVLFGEDLMRVFFYFGDLEVDRLERDWQKQKGKAGKPMNLPNC